MRRSVLRLALKAVLRATRFSAENYRMRSQGLLRRLATIAGGACLVVAWTHLPAVGAFTDQRATWLNTFGIIGYSASLADIDNDGDLDLLFQGSNAQTLFRNDTI